MESKEDMKLQNQEIKKQLLSRLRRIEGQVRGVQGMIDEERDCQEILQQLSAIRSAVQGTSVIFLKEYAVDCMVNLEVENRGDREKFVHDIINLMGKTP
jgi:CsoR family transcriptional regulator, copper-sensing transcriptional repressor